MVVSVVASKLETQDLVSVIASSLTGQRFRTEVDLLQSHLHRPETQNSVSVNVVSIAVLKTQNGLFLLLPSR